MKVVINKCYGGFSISALAVKRIAELQGRACYFYIYSGDNLIPIKIEDIQKSGSSLWSAYDIPDASSLRHKKAWSEMTDDERHESNELHEKHSISERPDKRDDHILVRVVEELGSGANGRSANLEVVEIPDGVDYEVEEYDGMESIHEKHRAWG